MFIFSLSRPRTKPGMCSSPRLRQVAHPHDRQPTLQGQVARPPHQQPQLQGQVEAQEDPQP